MRTRTLLIILCGAILMSLAIGGTGGYLLRAQKTDGSLVLSATDSFREEYLAPPDSFSRVKNTKSSLDVLSVRLGAGIIDAISAYDRLRNGGESERRKAEQVLERAIQAAERAMQEFAGTEQQWELARCLLIALQKAGRFERWTEVYIKALQERPTHPIVSSLAHEAVTISQLAGQQKAVLETLNYLARFPAEFPRRASIEAAL